ncbi:MAG TPA: hypothetical protein VJ350_02710 [Methanoregula sp.]|nr:hypothetical protein [Methanoregula sp.]
MVVQPGISSETGTRERSPVILEKELKITRQVSPFLEVHTISSPETCLTLILAL